jgi:ubiquitin C-terminal hydrolase
MGAGLSVDLPDLTAPLDSQGRLMLNLQDILNRFFMDADAVAACSTCAKETPHKRNLSLADPPEILVVHAKLFYFQNQTSKKAHVVIEPNDALINAAGPERNHSILYRVYAVVAHVGASIQSGHYITVACGSGCSAKIPSCCSPSGCWWLFDDGSVSGPMLKHNALEKLTQMNVRCGLDLNSLVSITF